MSSGLLSGTRTGHSALIRSAITCLLVITAGLSIPAKKGHSLPKSHRAHHVSAAVKVDVADSQVRVAGGKMGGGTPFLLPSPRAVAVRLYRTEVPSVVPISVRISIQHRPPPFW